MAEMFDQEAEAARQERIRVATERENATLTPEQKSQRKQMADETMQRIKDEAFADQAPVYLNGNVPLDDVMNLVKPNVRSQAQPEPTEPTAPTEPTEPTTTPTEPTATPGEQPQTTIGTDGKGRTTFGSYVRVVDQKTGEVSWEDTNGNPVEAPKSQQMMEKMNAGSSS